ncbi:MULTISPECIES: hypothetical protein [Vibrio]|uniref:Outer membrane protein beta-barrel domain-containing protein n=1 Tax=Vibrio ezurae NBRC 102218 TaxID=1219080 RepID=U3CL04_9VIBR|nr:hypothetical protein [Vibrio ezurae]MPW35352.1 hypothetical protein [Vibrio sp. B1Z05]GAD78858.1 hypothetical protein VEZ01S_07_00350 [Vibrio ezurae NBRC 102218]
MNLGKLALVTVVLTGLATYVGAAKAATSNGSAVKLGMGLDQGLSVVVNFEDRYNLSVGNDGMAFDYHFSKGSFSDDIPFTWFVGAGAWYEWNDDFGLRVPLGLDWNFAPNWNAYGHINPEWQLQQKSRLQFGAGIGVTYRF